MFTPTAQVGSTIEWPMGNLTQTYTIEAIDHEQQLVIAYLVNGYAAQSKGRYRARWPIQTFERRTGRKVATDVNTNNS